MFTEDHAAFFADFGQSATIGGQAVTGIFDSAHALGAVGDFGASTTQPRLTLPTAQVPANPVGQAVVVAEQDYVVEEHHPDGTGVSVLLLGASA